MKVAIRSGSSAVRRTLADIVHATGHEHSDDNAELIVEEGAQPMRANENGIPRLTLTNLPTRPAELAQHIRLALAATRRPLLALASGWKLETGTRQLHYPDMAPIPLTEKECLLLAALLHANPEPVTRETLLKDIWAYGEGAETHTLETHIYRLRAKLNALHPKPCDIVAADSSYRLVME